MTVPRGSAVLALLGDVSGDAAADVRAKATLLLDYPHVDRLVVDLRGVGAVESALLDELDRLATCRGKRLVLRHS